MSHGIYSFQYSGLLSALYTIYNLWWGRQSSYIHVLCIYICALYLFTVREVESRLVFQQTGFVLPLWSSGLLAVRMEERKQKCVQSGSALFLKRPCSPWAEDAFITQNPGEQSGHLPSPQAHIFCLSTSRGKCSAARRSHEPPVHVFLRVCLCVCVRAGWKKTC